MKPQFKPEEIYLDLSKLSNEQQERVMCVTGTTIEWIKYAGYLIYHKGWKTSNKSWLKDQNLTELTYSQFLDMIGESEEVLQVENEQWKDVIGYEGSYQVSNLGNIKSLFTNRGKMMKPYKDKDGYMTVNLYLEKKRKLHKVHRLVAKSFIINPEDKNTVNHINSIRDDNRVSNLEWATFSENNQHAFDHGNQRPMKGDKCWLYDISSENHPNAKKVINLQNGRIYECLKDATKDLGLKYSNVLSKINLTQKGYNDTGLVFLDDLKDIPQEIKVRVGTTIFEYELKQQSKWIKIESEADLPKEVDQYWFASHNNKIEIRFYNPDWINDRVQFRHRYTHYQPIVKPLPLNSSQ